MPFSFLQLQLCTFSVACSVFLHAALPCSAASAPPPLLTLTEGPARSLSPTHPSLFYLYFEMSLDMPNLPFVVYSVEQLHNSVMGGVLL